MIDHNSKKWLSKNFNKNVKFNEPMDRHTSLRVGGPAQVFVAPESPEKLVELIKWCGQKKIPYTIFGNGTNLLVKDSGIRGVVIVLTKCLNKITQMGADNDRVIVTALSGARLQTLCRFAIENSLKGMNFALGIPGTVGGGISMNAGTACGTMESVLDSIEILLPTGKNKIISKNNLCFECRKLSWNMEKEDAYKDQSIILSGCFCLHHSDPQELKEEANKILKTRRKNQPKGLPNAGCFFKNPSSGKTAGKLIEMAGLKGKSIGGAKISSKHANFILNTGGASASDMLALMELVQEKVLKIFNIELETEIKIVGE
ncbi:MAG: UDP-N-acetylmuramate dehydrogenase [Deltaproteobacteria bacterium]|nr:UDP-N-acetylmuramate dehydrogenase [Deltaproteobacteria bacterium]MBW2661713.1 UDP-N-acetylmuramate dehydrogenase [Deltaproteobacteria bacterium]